MSRCPLLLLLVALPLLPVRSHAAPSPGESPHHGWISLFDGKSLGGWSPVEFGGDGEVKVDDGALVIGAGGTLTGVRWTLEAPAGDYEVDLEAMRVRGSDIFCGLTFPAAGSSASLIIGGWGGGVCGISSLDGMDASENETSSHRSFDNGRWYRIRLRVAAGWIEAWIDGEPIVEVETANRRIDTRAEIRLSKPFGLASWRTTAALRRVRWRRVDAARIEAQEGADAGEASAPPDEDRFEKTVLVPACEDPMQIDVLEDGRLYFIERNGKLKLHRPGTPRVETLGQVPVAVFGEVGLLGLALERDFERSGRLYLFFCPAGKSDTMRLSRFTIAGVALDLASERVILEYPIDAGGAIHMGGGLCLAPDGNLLIGAGDNCPPIPELPVDQRPGRENFDALRTSANSMDLRGKVLRIRPGADGGHAVPDGNLFPDGKEGRPELFAMGCRNPFRVTADPRTGWVYWGDVGPNVRVDLGIGPNGYDEVNQAREPGNFGWPMFVGPNEAYAHFDFDAMKPGAKFDAASPVNDSRNNTGLKRLPPPRPAFIWYPTGDSEKFPELGNGGRSAMAGPVYYFDPTLESGVKLPACYHRTLFVYEWTRNWIKAVKLDGAGRIARIEPFLAGMVFRKPIDMELGPDGSLYVVEYGDKWVGNSDAQIVRITYPRGNRAPLAVAEASPLAGRQPLAVELSAKGSRDKDPGDLLRYEWRLDGGSEVRSREVRTSLRFEKPGTHMAHVTVIDSSGASSTAKVEVQVGNAMPGVTIVEPANGGFFDWRDWIRYRVDVEDAEDGGSAGGQVAADRVVVRPTYRERRRSTQVDAAGRPVEAGDGLLEPGLALMRRGTCFSCHTAQSQSAGPSYAAVGARYRGDPTARERLARKVVAGGAGAWGPLPMPAQPQHTVEDARTMIDWVLSLGEDPSRAPAPGLEGAFQARERPEHRGDAGVYVITASYTDRGADGAPPLTGEAECVLHSRRKKASFFDLRHGVEIVDEYEGEGSIVAWFARGDHIAFEDVNLGGIDRITCRVGARPGVAGRFEVRSDDPSGPLLAEVQVPAPDKPSWADASVPIRDPGGLHALYFVARAESAAGGRGLGLNWIDFIDDEKVAEASRPRTKVLLVPTKLDHAWGTHMYSHACALLAKCLGQTPGVDAVVSPDLDWPRDPRLLEGVKAIVYYSRSAGDILLGGPAREHALKLFEAGCGLTAIHWATGADDLKLGPAYLDLLGGWFHFAHAGLKVDTRPLVPLEPDHPICRGWKPYDLHDELYLNLKFHRQARPLLKVDVDGKEQVVAWTLERPGGGRSFGTTLGHFHENFAIEAFRRALVNGILWTAQVEVPEGGAPVTVSPEDVRIPPEPRPFVRNWTTSDLTPSLGEVDRGRSLERGKRVFTSAGCGACHRLAGEGGTLGPDLAAIPQKIAEKKMSRADLLRELIEPSAAVEEKYRSSVLVTRSGEIVAGIITSSDGNMVRIAFNPTDPEQAKQIPAAEIVSKTDSPASMMPEGLLVAYSQDEILDLIACLERGGR